jgi:choline dehydrogenase-like flavoprotein
MNKRGGYGDTWFPYTHPAEMERRDYDVLIIGTGGGGGAVLWRLCEQWGRNGKRIGVIEAGAPFLPTHLFNIPTLNVDAVLNYWRNPKYLRRITEAYSSDGFAKTPVEFLTVKALGGKTNHWGAATPRMHWSDLAQWPVSLQAMDQYYHLAERIMNVNQRFAEGSAIHDAMLRRLRSNGFADAIAMPRAVDLQQTQSGRIHSSVFFNSLNFLSMALFRKPFDLAVRTHAVRLMAEKGRIQGIQVMTPDKQSYTLKAKHVIVSAGNVETPRLLLHSGIPGHAIGHYLVNHSRLDAQAVVERGGFPEVVGVLDVLLPGTESRPYQLQIDWLPFIQYGEKPLLEDWQITLIPSGAVESRYENRLTLDPVRKDEYGVPLPLLFFSYSQRDIEVIRLMAEGIIQAAAAMNVALLEKDGVPHITLRRPGGENHDTGTCRIGVDPETSAADSYGQIHGVHGLYAADNSVIPSSGTANPTLTTVALAFRTADYIIERSK